MEAVINIAMGTVAKIDGATASSLDDDRHTHVRKHWRAEKKKSASGCRKVSKRIRQTRRVSACFGQAAGSSVCFHSVPSARCRSEVLRLRGRELERQVGANNMLMHEQGWRFESPREPEVVENRSWNEAWNSEYESLSSSSVYFTSGGSCSPVEGVGKPKLSCSQTTDAETDDRRATVGMWVPETICEEVVYGTASVVVLEKSSLLCFFGAACAPPSSCCLLCCRLLVCTLAECRVLHPPASQR